MTALSYASGSASEALLGETIGDNLDRVAAALGDTPCLVSRHQDIRWTYAEFLEQVDRCAGAFLSLGVERGDRVALWSPNRAEWTLVQYALAKIGAILVNVNPAYRAHELAYALNQSGSSVLVSAASFKTSDYVSMVAEIRGDVGGLKTAMFFDGDGGDVLWGDFLDGASRATAGELEMRQRSLQFDDPINIQYTSGTTGAPKGATLSHHNLLNNGYAVTGIQALSAGDALCVPVPLYHVFGMMVGNLGATSRGLTLVYPSESFEPGATLAAIEAEGCAAVYGVPTMFIAMLDHPDFSGFDLSSLRTGAMGGSPCPIEVMKRVVAEMHMDEVTIIYGMTETGVSFQCRPDDPLDRRVSTVGRVLPHAECKIVDPESGAVVAAGQPGELCTRGYLVMPGYWDNPSATAGAIDSSRWMHTGDMATMDEEGYVNIVGRIKDMVIRGGENVYPREVEEFLYGHPAVADVQVIGVPDVRLGEELCAWVRVRDGHSLTIDEVRTFCADRIAHYKVPRYLRLTDEFPMTVTGKVQKFRMREISIDELSLQAAAEVVTA